MATKVTQAMVDRFLNWKLPEDFHPDAGISFSPFFNVEYNAKQGKPPQRHEPIGTNLLTATQAKAMLEHVLAETTRSETAVQEFLLDATRFKLSFDNNGKTDAFWNYADALQGRWIALVAAEDDRHIKASRSAIGEWKPSDIDNMALLARPIPPDDKPREDFSERWLQPGTVVPVDMNTTSALLAEVRRLRASRSSVAEKDAQEAHSILDKHEVGRRISMDGGKTWREYGLAERVKIICGSNNMLERELEITTRDRDARAREACTAEGRTGCSFARSATATLTEEDAKTISTAALHLQTWASSRNKESYGNTLDVARRLDAIVSRFSVPSKEIP